MRFAKIAVLVSALTLCAAAAHAAPITYGLGGGLAFPTGDAGDVIKMGYNANVYGDYWLSPKTAIGVDIDGNFFSGKDDAVDALKSATYPDPSISFNTTGFNAHVIYAFPMQGSKMEPWLRGGLGFYTSKLKIKDAGPTFDSDQSNTDFGFHLGGGLDWAVGNGMKAGLDAKYTSVMTEDESTNFYSIGLHLTFAGNGGSK